MKRRIFAFLLIIISILVCACSSKYTEEDLEVARAEAYQEGYDDGVADLESEVENAYQNGYEAALIDYNVDPGVSWATVYYTDGGDCYHTNPSCLSLRGSDNIHEISLEELYRSGSDLRPCDICVAHSDD